MPPKNYPDYFFTQPFCEEGDRTIPTDDQPAEGRTSLTLGFPPETQKPIRDGGIAPDRWDFNGILYMLSAMSFWIQKGGQWKYDATFSYEPPSFCYYGDNLWYCIKENGPNTSHPAPVAPGTNTTYWVDLLWFIAGKKYCSRTGNTIKLTGNYVTGTGTIDTSGECSFSPVVHQSDTLTVSRNIGLTGDVTGSGSFDGSKNITINTTVSSALHMTPDWSRASARVKVTPSTTFTCPTNGYFNVRIGTNAIAETAFIYINGYMVTGASQIDEIDETIPCAAGDRITFSGNWTDKGDPYSPYYWWIPVK